MLFTFECVKKLNRQTNQIYLGTVSLGVIKSWKFPTIEAIVVNNDVVIVNYEALVNTSTYEIQVTNPAFLYTLPNGSNTDEYPVLFVTQNNYLPKYCEQQLMSYDFFNRLIEKDGRLSSNSTKVITLRTLRDILKRLVKIRIDRIQWPNLSRNMVTYLQSLTKEYPYLGYLPVAERKTFRKQSTADASFAWEFYFRYFIEEWVVENSTISVPDMSKSFEYNNWSGNFFDRENPFWDIYVGPKGKFLFHDAHIGLIYEIWKEWVKGA